MTTLGGPVSLTRGVSLLPDIGRDDEVPLSPEAKINAFKTDAAIEMNRRSTPQAVVNQRKAPRFSLTELNALDERAVQARLQQLQKEEKPGWVKALDLIDLPRNMVANTVTRVALPEARRMALERGDFDQFGNAKVYGSDVLRALGVENRVVLAIGGFFTDVVTDPLSWVGGPIGGLKTAGTKGAVQISKEGQRALRTGVKAFRQGRPLADDATKAMFDAVLKDGIAKGALAADADMVAKADFIQTALLGSQGRASQVAERVGLGGSTRGGLLADDTKTVIRATDENGVELLNRTAEEAARIESVKAWVAKHTNNRGVDLSKGKGGAEIAHIPFTDRTLTVPEFKIPGLGFQPGRAAALQRAMALATEGKVRQGYAVVAAADDAARAAKVGAEATELLNDKLAADNRLTAWREENAPRAAAAQAELAQIDAQLQAMSQPSADLFTAAPDPLVAEALQARRTEVVAELNNALGADLAVQAEVLRDRLDDVLDEVRPRVDPAPGDEIVINYERIKDDGVRTALLDQFGDDAFEVDGVTASGRPIVGGVPLPKKYVTIVKQNTDIRPIPALAQRRLERQAGRAATGDMLVREIEDIGDAMAIVELNQIADGEARRAVQTARWADVSDRLYRADAQDVGRARVWKQDLARELADKTGLAYAEESVDEILDVARQDQSLAQLIAQRQRMADARLQDILDLSEKDLDFAEEVATAFNANVEAAMEVASLRHDSVQRLLNRDVGLIADAVRSMVKIDDRQMGYLPMTRLSSILRNRNMLESADKVKVLGEWLAANVGGGQSGLVPQLMQGFRRAFDTGSVAEGQAFINDFRRGTGAFEVSGGYDALVAKHTGHSHADLLSLFTMRAEQRLRSEAGLASPILLTTEGSAGRNLIERLTKSGALQDADLLADVDRLLDQALPMLQDIAKNAQLRGDVASPIAQYFPAQLSPEAGAAVRRLAGNSGADKIARDSALMLTDPNRPRVTNMVEFMGKDGKVKQFLVLDYETIGKTPKEEFEQARALNKANPRMEQIRADIEEFFEQFGDLPLGDRDRVIADRARALLPFELNELAARGHFDALVGGGLVNKGDMWSTDFSSLMANRVRADAQQEAVHGFREAIEPFVLAKFDPREAHNIRGDTAITKFGQEIKRIGTDRFLFGGAVYRTLDESKLNANSLFVPEVVYGTDAKNMLIPDVVATQIERMNDAMHPDKIGPIMGIAETTTGLFKTSTLLHPSWTISNVIGSSILLAMRFPELLNPASAREFGKDFGEAMKTVIRHNTGGRMYASKGTVSVGGTFVPTQQLIREMLAGGVINSNQAADAQQQFSRALISSRPLGAEAAPLGWKSEISARYHRNMAEYTAMRGELGDLSRPTNRLTQLRAGAKAIQMGPASRALRAWFAANGMVDDTFRAATYLYLRRQGYDAATAAIETRKALLNFGDMTSFEKNYVRPLIPFYAWMRASAPNMLGRLIHDPKQIAAVPKAAEAFEELMAGEGAVPRHERPRWLQETLALQVGSDPETARTLQFGTLIPQESTGQIVSGLLGTTGLAGFNGQDFLDSLSWLGGQFGPPVKLPVELATGRETFTGRTIGPSEGRGDVTTAQYLAGQVRWLRETGVGNPNPGGLERAFQDGVGTGVGRLLVGGRLAQNIGQDDRQRGQRYELVDRVDGLRKAIAAADRRGDQEAGERLRAELLAVYANHLNNGGSPDDVPAWARRDIEAIGVLR